MVGGELPEMPRVAGGELPEAPREVVVCGAVVDREAAAGRRRAGWGGQGWAGRLRKSPAWTPRWGVAVQANGEVAALG